MKKFKLFTLEEAAQICLKKELSTRGKIWLMRPVHCYDHETNSPVIKYGVCSLPASLLVEAQLSFITEKVNHANA